MFNSEREWLLMEQHQREQIRQAWADRLAEEATCDQASLAARIALALSSLLTAFSLRLKAHYGRRAEKAHHYIASPHDRAYS